MKRALAAALLAGAAASIAAGAPEKATETVVVTHRVRPGEETAYGALLAKQWTTLRRLGLVLPQPHVLLRGDDDAGRPVFVEVFTWRDHDAADTAPDEVWAIWRQMNARVETRLGRPGIEFPEFQIVPLPD